MNPTAVCLYGVCPDYLLLNVADNDARLPARLNAS